MTWETEGGPVIRSKSNLSYRIMSSLRELVSKLRSGESQLEDRFHRDEYDRM